MNTPVHRATSGTMRINRGRASGRAAACSALPDAHEPFLITGPAVVSFSGGRRMTNQSAAIAAAHEAGAAGDLDVSSLNSPWPGVTPRSGSFSEGRP